MYRWIDVYTIADAPSLDDMPDILTGFYSAELRDDWLSEKTYCENGAYYLLENDMRVYPLDYQEKHYEGDE